MKITMCLAVLIYNTHQTQISIIWFMWARLLLNYTWNCTWKHWKPHYHGFYNHPKLLIGMSPYIVFHIFHVSLLKKRIEVKNPKKKTLQKFAHLIATHIKNIQMFCFLFIMHSILHKFISTLNKPNVRVEISNTWESLTTRKGHRMMIYSEKSMLYWQFVCKLFIFAFFSANTC
jgi:hypothetical protein